MAGNPQQTQAVVRRFVFMCDACSTRGLFETATADPSLFRCVACGNRSIKVKMMPQKPAEPEFNGYGGS